MKLNAYYRVSTDDQKNGLEVYKKQCYDFCERYGHKLVNVYVDEDVSGGIGFKDRPQGSLCYKDFADGKVNGLVCPNVARLFRDARDGMNTAYDLSEIGVTVYFCDNSGMPLDLGTTTGFLTFIMNLSFSHLERLTVRERTKNAMTVMRKSGRATSHAPYGYDKGADGKLIKNEKEMEGVNTILKLDGFDYTLKEICAELHRLGIPSKMGGNWSPKTVRGVIEYQKKLV